MPRLLEIGECGLELNTRRDPELDEDLAHVVVGGARADEQSSTDGSRLRTPQLQRRGISGWSMTRSQLPSA